MKQIIWLSIILTSCSIKQLESASYINYDRLEFKEDIAYYKEKPFTGKVIAYFENGSKKMEAEFVDGIDNGDLMVWDEEGRLIEVSNLVNGVLNGSHTRFYPNGQKMIQVDYKEGKPDGRAREWHENGQLKIETTYSVGQELGSYILYDEKGQEVLNGFMKNGVRDSVWIEYNKFNSKTYRNLYKNGELIEFILLNK